MEGHYFINNVIWGSSKACCICIYTGKRRPRQEKKTVKVLKHTHTCRNRGKQPLIVSRSYISMIDHYMCLFPGIISCILTRPNIKIQDGHQRLYWKFNSKENSPGNRYNITFHINYGTQNPFLASFVHFDRSECQNSRWSPSVISIVFRFKPCDPLFLLNVTSETRFKQYLLILRAAFAHISTVITRKSKDI